MATIVKISLKPGKDEAVRRFHPWIFSGAINKVYGNIAEGDVVEVYSNRDEYLATGHYQIGSIAIRIFSFNKENPDINFWKSKLAAAYHLREVLGLTDNINTNVYRLVHAEGDGLPGLIIDFYNGTAVIQSHSIGMHYAKPLIVDALKEIYQDKLNAVYDKSSETLPKMAKIDCNDGYLFGAAATKEVLENGHAFFVDWEGGQKTGFFIDQRDNRKLLSEYAKEKKIVNTFCYSGGFSVYALKAGAEMVHSVDSSKKAIELTEKNLLLGNFNSSQHQSFAEDTMDFLKNTNETYDIVVLDPPAYAKHNDAKHNAIQGYKRLNALAMSKINKGGILFTFSCSQVINRQLFNATITAAAIESGRQIKILHQLSQPADHPVNIYHPEGEYLKGLVLYID
ncbi:MAG: rRNA large subunit methyltransferase I [Bacteroidetes bacterium CG2_30_32_10]|nr:MAG: rRNA large subunit methyltransferase I [Bacteroidetes bacterium CG2_30_32_10]